MTDTLKARLSLDQWAAIEAIRRNGETDSDLLRAAVAAEVERRGGIWPEKEFKRGGDYTSMDWQRKRLYRDRIQITARLTDDGDVSVKLFADDPVKADEVQETLRSDKAPLVEMYLVKGDWQEEDLLTAKLRASMLARQVLNGD